MRILFIANTDSRQRYRFVMEPLRSVGVQIFCFKEQRNLIVSFFRGIRSIQLHPKFDVAVLTGCDLRNVIWYILFRTIFNMRVVIRLGGDPVAVPRSAQNSFLCNKKLIAAIRSKVGTFGARLLMKGADGVIVVSEYLAHSVRPMLGEKTHLLVLPPVLLKMCKSKIDYKQEGEWFNILTVANLNYYEKADGVIIIAKAIKSACVSQPNLKIKLNVVGGGLQLERLERELAGLSLPENFILNLHGKQRDVYPYFESTDIFTYHSTLDSYPLVLLEAAAHGLPMVINRWGPFPELYEEKKEALFYETKNEVELKSLIVRLFENENLRAQLGQAANSGFIENQSSVSRGGKLVSFLEQVLQSANYKY